MLDRLIQADLYAIMLIFARFGSAMMVLPGLGQQTVPARVRLVLAIAVSLAAAPAVAPMVPKMPESVLSLVMIVLGEVVIGFFIGTLANILASALQIAGMIMAFQSNLASATIFNPMLAQEVSAFGSMLATMAMVLIFVTNLDHQAIAGLVDSYRLFAPGIVPDAQLMTGALTRVVSDSFRLAVQLSAPFLVLSFVFNVGLGLLARMVPQMQVFFVGIPLQILGALAALAISLSAGLGWFLQHYAGLFEQVMARQ
ncbi:MAG: flagellar biosynthetic protein FliR [Alphaproteobacteria bacterium]|nr:flagellar biosynthetic protein FliR [Alphaproteobacteria bacterium]